MTSAVSYLFYDLETSGLNPAFDQILQFAAIHTDADFRELARHEFRIRLRPDVIPSPGALLATDIFVRETITTGRQEYEAIREMHALFNQPRTISVGYNSLGFDDLFLRFAFYRNLLPPYTHQYHQGCGRLDLFPITVLYWLQNSPRLIWPTSDGRPTLKLEFLNEANGLAVGQAHDALVDVAATVALARRLRQDEALWASCLTLFDKNDTSKRIKELPRHLERPFSLLINAKFGYDQCCQAPALYLGETNHTGRNYLWLQLDKPELRQTTRANIAETAWVIRQKPGQPPFLQPPRPNKLSPERIQIVRDNMDWLRNNPELLEAIAQHYLTHSFDGGAPDADAALYANGFLSDAATRQCARFHQLTLPEKLDFIPQFADETVRELAIRLLARNEGVGYRFPTYAEYERQLRDDSHPPLDFRGGPRLTPQAALREIAEKRTDALSERQKAILDDLEQYILYYLGV